MFIAVALMCLDLNLTSCTQMIWDGEFLTEQQCLAHNQTLIGTLGPKGTIVQATCFEVTALGEPV